MTSDANNNKLCTCLPYNDGLLITAQILSFIAIILSWTSVITLLMGLVAFICLQLVWCCRMNKCGLITVGVLTIIASIADLIIGIGTFVEGSEKICDGIDASSTLFIQNVNVNDNAISQEDINNISNELDKNCGPWVNMYAGLALASGILWLIITFLIFYFTCGNRIKRFDSNNNSNNKQKVPRATTNGVDIVMDDNEGERESERERKQTNQNRSVTGVVTGDVDNAV